VRVCIYNLLKILFHVLYSSFPFSDCLVFNSEHNVPNLNYMCLPFDSFFLICLCFSPYLRLFCMTRETVALWWDKLNGAATGPYYVLYCSSLHPLPSPHPPFSILESHISLVPITPLRIMNFLCHLLALTRMLKRSVKRGGETRARGLIYVQ